MRCPDCDYRLWHVVGRTCPECGRPFKPSEFEFAPESVAFCCPHCDQAYYGTTENGHLDPLTFDCVQCGQPIDMDEMVLRPADGVEERDTLVDVNPWVDRRKQGRFKAYFKTIWHGLARPGRLTAAVPAKNSPLAGLGYLLLNLVLFNVASWLGLFVFAAVISVVTGGGSRSSGIIDMAGIMLLPALGVVLVGMVGTLMWATISHVLLVISGCRPQRGWAGTLDGLCYTSGIHFPTAVPCLGSYMSLITLPAWWVTATLAVRHAQRTPVMRTILAVAALPVLVSGAGIGLLVWTINAAMPYAAGPMGMQGAWEAQTWTVTQAILDHGAQHQGAGPLHALQLVVDQRVQVSDFLTPGSPTAGAGCKVGGMELANLSAPGPHMLKLICSKAIADLPADTVAHRMGDFVLVYHGMSLDTAAPTAWVTVLWPDPAANPVPPQHVVVGQADGQTRLFATHAFPQSLQIQNAWRVSAGLPPLPMPDTVTHDKPATASASPAAP